MPRGLHPGAWWLWALGLAAAASRTTNPLLLLLVIAVAGWVVVARRTDAPWALGFRLYLWLGGIIVVSRVLFRLVLGGGQGDHVLLTLPQVPLPEVASGIRLFGPVAAEQLLGGFYDGLRLAAMVVCVGAANALANPKRMLRALPGALYEVGTAVVVALSVAPQLVDSVLRVRRARRLRGGGHRGLRALRGILMPVLQDALDRSLALAAAMDSRGYGRRGDDREGGRRGWRRHFRARGATGQRRLSGVLVTAGLAGVCVGVYGLLDSTVTGYLGGPMLLLGLASAAVGMSVGGRLVSRTVYRPDRWRSPELLVAGCGLVAGAGLWLAIRVDPAPLYPSLDPLAWPSLAVLPAVAILVAALPAVAAPPPPGPPGGVPA